MEAEASGEPVGGEAALLLRDQRRLINADLRHRGWQIASERVGFALKILTGLAGVAVAASLGAMVWSAAQDDSVVIEPIAAPEDLVRQGATGPALARALQDKLVRMQSDTQTMFTSAQVRQKDAAELKVQIPATGVSLADLDVALRQWVGHQTHISAEVSRVASGPEKGALAVNARVGAQPGVRLVQADGNLDALLAGAAEYAYGASQPLNYAAWLGQHGRFDEGVAILERQTKVGSDMDRANAYLVLGSAKRATTSPQLVRDLLAESVRLSHGRVGLNDLAVSENALGHSEAAYRAWAKQAKTNTESGAGLTDEGRAFIKILPQANAARMLGDHNAPLGIPCARLKISPCSAEGIVRTVRADPKLAEATRDNRVTSAVQSLAELHDIPGAESLLSLRPPPAAGTPPQLQAVDDSNWLGLRVLFDREREDWAAVLRDVDAWDAMAVNATQRSPYNAGSSRGLALAAMGDASGARRAAALLPLDCYRCLIRRAEIAAMLGDRADADHWFAEAVRQGPSLPLAEAAWARALLKQGRVDASLVQAEAASRKGPRFADAYEIWGEGLLAKGDARGAAKQFDAAATLSPHWGRLRLKWGEALARQGKAAEARAQYRTAAGLYLTAAERAELGRRADT